MSASMRATLSVYIHKLHGKLMSDKCPGNSDKLLLRDYIEACGLWVLASSGYSVASVVASAQFSIECVHERGLLRRHRKQGFTIHVHIPIWSCLSFSLASLTLNIRVIYSPPSSFLLSLVPFQTIQYHAIPLRSPHTLTFSFPFLKKFPHTASQWITAYLYWIL